MVCCATGIPIVSCDVVVEVARDITVPTLYACRIDYLKNRTTVFGKCNCLLPKAMTELLLLLFSLTKEVKT